MVNVSNRKDITIICVEVHYFQLLHRVKVKVSDIQSVTREMSEIVTNHLINS